jgi:hypothetical protein
MSDETTPEAPPLAGLPETGSPAPPADKPSIEQQEVYVSIWKIAVDTQMHFNEMSVKARQFGLTFVAAALGLGVVLMSRDQEFSLPISYFGGFELHAIVVLVIASAFSLYAVRLLDLNVYHKMLRGAVAFGEDFEESYMKQIFNLEKGMTQAISQFSRHADTKVDKKAKPYQYSGESLKTAGDKLARFYNISIGALVVLALGLFIMTGHFGQRRPIPAEPAVSNPATAVAPITPATTKPPGGADAK